MSGVLIASIAGIVVSKREADLIVGKPADEATTLPVTTPPDPAAAATAAAGGEGPADGPGADPSGRLRPEPGSRRGLVGPDGRPYGSPVPFNANIPIPRDLVFVLLIGSDARPGEPVDRARADSIHLVAANPRTGQATVIGFPRDSWVKIPGHGESRINDAMVFGGPDLLAKTINQFTGLPIHYWVLAGFDTFTRIVDEVGGVNVYVDRRMDDRYSGAYFERGWHHFVGGEALAYSRDRHDTPDGDFTRSLNQGKLALAGLVKLRAEVGDEGGLRKWVEVAFRHLVLRVSFSEAMSLLSVARQTIPEKTTNLVLPGRAGNAGSRSVVFLDAREAARVADDVRPDAAIGPEDPPRTTTSGPTTSTSTSTSTTTTPTSTSDQPTISAPT
jgi:LCP family protein required for cell wall assembly